MLYRVIAPGPLAPVGTLVHAEPGSPLYERYGGEQGLAEVTPEQAASMAQGHGGTRNSAAGAHGTRGTQPRQWFRITDINGVPLPLPPR